jgi:TonB family protein
MNIRNIALLIFLILSISCFSQEKQMQKSDSVHIGSQTWMVKNLDVDHYRNGDPIPEVKDPKVWANLTTGAWCYYGNDPANGKIYGKLYNWYAVNDPRGLAPEGWHIASDDEWAELEKDSGGQSVGSNLKSKGIKGKNAGLWLKPNYKANNKLEFCALPAGIRSSQGWFDFINHSTIWWTTTISKDGAAKTRLVTFNSDGLFSRDYSMEFGFSVRCIKGIKNQKFELERGEELKSDGADNIYLEGMDLVNDYRSDTYVLSEIPPENQFIPVEKLPEFDMNELKMNLVYPKLARKSGIQGKVIERVFVDKNGIPKVTRISQSDSQMLEQAAINAIEKLKFKPDEQNGKPIGFWISIPINFKLND